ncbi:MAG: SAM-dependent methyltransferase [Undibacterium sp.]|nr:SAM-dependent methyltransferase [Opitutaceae bacterium]
MGSSATSSSSVASPEFARLFRAQAGPGGTMTFVRFMALALYAPNIGYYARPKPRVGYGPGTDFFTASTSGPVFGELIAAACVKLLGDRNPREFTFVELGAETERGVLASVTHPFGHARTVPLGARIQLRGPSVIFSNELFDAQPFHRFVFRHGAWREIGVKLNGDTLTEVELSTATQAPLPQDAPEGYVIDAPLAASSLLDEIASQAWTGLFIACDYGKSWAELTTALPAGTARAYFRHTQSNDLLAQPGDQDLTCHICWDWLVDRLTAHRFTNPTLESQEAFLVRHAGDFIAATSFAEAGRFSPKKLALMQLLHPAHLGQKFQALHALREEL